MAYKILQFGDFSDFLDWPRQTVIPNAPFLLAGSLRVLVCPRQPLPERWVRLVISPCPNVDAGQRLLDTRIKGQGEVTLKVNHLVPCWCCLLLEDGILDAFLVQTVSLIRNTYTLLRFLTFIQISLSSHQTFGVLVFAKCKELLSRGETSSI